ncbi:MAG: ureidoglycolate lyase [Rhizobiaceae bacterium MnEN-MB40S]|nr:MAG: ureidoglycolate lyase [Rhizobiaceae bacterium MnEN-MB40S]
MTIRLEVRNLSKGAFEPFGDVIETEGAEVRLINGGTTERFHALAQAQTGGGAAIVSIFRGQPRYFPYAVTMMERHPLGSQAFYPLQDRPWLVVVAQDVDGRPGSPEVFLASGAQGVNYRANIWHHPLMALDDLSDFLVVDREGEGNNLEEFDYPDPYEINWSK